MAERPAFQMTALSGGLAEISLFPGAGPAVDRLGDLLGRDGPATGMVVPVAPELALVQVAPRRVMVLTGAAGEAPDLTGLVDPAHVMVTPLGEGWRRFGLVGSRVVAVLAKLVALDLELPAFPPGRAAPTLVHRVSVLLHRRAETEFDLYLPRSFAVSLSEMIADAAEEFAAGPAA